MGADNLSSIALRVAVAGHRQPPKLSKEQIPGVRKAVRRVLTSIKSIAQSLVGQFPGYNIGAPRLKVISSLAEGADRLVAEEGLILGFELECPLPAFREEYRLDFSGDSLEVFDALIGKAQAVFELPGERGNGEYLKPAAYEAASRVMIAHSDVLIAIWDGDEGETGGTAQTTVEARRLGISTLIINPQEPDEIRVESKKLAAPDLERWLRQAIKRIVSAPPSVAVEGFELMQEPIPAGADSASDQLATLRDRADMIATKLGERYRRTYRVLYILSPIAVACAIGGLCLLNFKSDSLPDWLLPSAELACIAAILVLAEWGRKGRWHERWLDARVLAEQFRTWSFLHPIGQTLSASRLPPYVSPKRVKGDWTAWYLRAYARAQSLPSVRLDPVYLAKYRERLLLVVQEQERHHERQGRSRERTYEAFELISRALFFATGIACILHLFVPHLRIFEGREVFWLLGLGALTAVLPAIGAALEGLQAQGEHQRLAERAEGMRSHLAVLGARIESLKDEPLTYSDLAHLAHELGGIMLDELSDWRNLISVRGLHTV